MKLGNYRKLPYPYNVLLATEEVKKAIGAGEINREVLIAKIGIGQATLTVRETVNREFSAYYISILPLYKLWQNPEEYATAELLTAVFAYLYISAGICYYRDEGNYMHYNYEIMNEWIEEGEEYEQGAYEHHRDDHNEAMIAGDIIQRKMMDDGLLQRLPQLINAYEPTTALHVETLRIAKKAQDIADRFPHATLLDHASEIEDNDDDHYYDSTVRMHEYISFVCSTSGHLGEMLIDMVENDFNERSSEQRPQLLTDFSEPHDNYKDGLAYERAVFSLIEDLCTLL